MEQCTLKSHTFNITKYLKYKNYNDEKSNEKYYGAFIFRTLTGKTFYARHL